MRATLVAIRHFEIGGRVFHHGSEIMPDLLSKESADKLIDQGVLREYRERRSLYRLFAPFSGAKEKESLDDDELNKLALTHSRRST
jgi:hypothetical protein